MPNFSKIIFNGNTLMDVTQDTVVADKLAKDYTATGSDGEKIVGTMSGGGGKNIQVYFGYFETNSESYIATDLSIKVAKAGTYKISWIGVRNSGSGSYGSRIYVNGTVQGSSHITFIRGYFQYCEDTLTLAENDTVVVYARARSSLYWMVVGNLILEEQ